MPGQSTWLNLPRVRQSVHIAANVIKQERRCAARLETQRQPATPLQQRSAAQTCGPRSPSSRFRHGSAQVEVGPAGQGQATRWAALAACHGTGGQQAGPATCATTPPHLEQRPTRGKAGKHLQAPAVDHLHLRLAQRLICTQRLGGGAVLACRGDGHPAGVQVSPAAARQPHPALTPPCPTGLPTDGAAQLQRVLECHGRPLAQRRRSQVGGITKLQWE